MKAKLILISILILSRTLLIAQDALTDVLKQVKQNNKSIMKFEHYTESQIMGSKINLNPADPALEFNYLWGEDAGTYLNEIGLVQKFEFPTVYSSKSKISEKQQETFQYRQQKHTWEILHETHRLCIGLTYLYKQEAEYLNRLANAEKLILDQKRRLEEGYGTTLEVEKASLHESLIRNNLQKIRSEIRIKKDHLRELNGGLHIDYEKSNYPEFDQLPSIDSLFEKLEAVDPVNKMLELQIDESDLDVKLAKAKKLPGFEIGYRYEREFLNTFNGLHLGFNIPLWEDKNKVSYSKLKVDYLYAEIDEHENAHYFEIKETYESFHSAKERLNRLNEVLSELKFEKNLKKALQEGEISSIDFYTEYLYLYDIRDNYLEAQKEYYLLLAELFKYHLLSLTL